MNTAPYKAVAAFIGTLVAAIWANVQANGGDPPAGVWEWVSIIVPAVLTTLAVYQITNTPKDPVARGQRGSTDVMFLTFAAVPLVLLGAFIVLAWQKVAVWFRVHQITRPTYERGHVSMRQSQSIHDRAKPLPPLPDSAYPAGAVQLPRHRRRFLHL